MKLLLIILAAVAAGPAISSLVVLIGCAGESPVLGTLCGHNSYIPLALFTLVVWLALAGLAARNSRARP